MGGHILLRYLHRQPRAFRRRRLQRPDADVLHPGRAAMAAAADHPMDDGQRPCHRYCLGHDQARSADADIRRADRHIGSGPLRSAPGIFCGASGICDWAHRPGAGWRRRCAPLPACRPDIAAHIATPVLICGAGEDLVCMTADTQAFRRGHAATAAIWRSQAARHEILMERDVFRAQFWTAFDRFMADR